MKYYHIILLILILLFYSRFNEFIDVGGFDFPLLRILMEINPNTISSSFNKI